MDLCLMIEGQQGVTWPQWVALAQACERHGVPALFRSDHYLELSGQHPEQGSLDAWTTIAALAAVTATLQLGTLVSPTTFRHPSKKRADDEGSSPRALRSCFRQLLSTYTSAFRTSRGVRRSRE